MSATFAVKAFSDTKQPQAEAWNTKLWIRALSILVEWKQKLYLGCQDSHDLGSQDPGQHINAIG